MQNRPANNRTITQSEEWTYQRKKNTIIRTLIMTALMIGVLINTCTGFVLPNSSVECVWDAVMNWSSSINNDMNEDTLTGNALKISSSVLLDVAIVTKFLHYIITNRSWVYFFSIALFYFNRMFGMMLFQITYPPGYAWTYPGFPSITVSYNKSHAFWYSSQIGLACISIYDSFNERIWWLFGPLTAITIYQALILSFLRGAYTIDIFSSIIASHLCFMVTSRLRHLIDDNRYLGFKNEKKKKDYYKLFDSINDESQVKETKEKHN